MDAFWVIPFAIVVIAFCCLLYAAIKSRPNNYSDSHVLVDKPASESNVDPVEENRDWANRPCGSFMDWLNRRSHGSSAK